MQANYPGRINRPFLCRTLNELQWSIAEEEYKYDNNNYGTIVVSSENIFGNYALHLLTKLDNGEFKRDLILVDGNYLNQYKFL